MSKKQTFEDALQALENAVEKLESGELPLEESLAWFEKGVKSAALCQKRLRQVQTQVEVLLTDEDGNPSLEPFDRP